MQMTADLRLVTPACGPDGNGNGTRVQSAALGSALQLLDQLYAHHPYTVAHSVSVARLTMAMWSVAPDRLGQYETVLLGALLHDAGKLFVPPKILGAAGKLTNAEFCVMRKHPEYGAVLLGRLDFCDAVVSAARDHHERWTGGGYPSAEPSSRLSPLARAVAVADAFSAMIEPGRSYRRAMTFAHALAELETCRGSQFDPEMVDLLGVGLAAWSDKAQPATGPEMSSWIAGAVRAIGVSAASVSMQRLAAA